MLPDIGASELLVIAAVALIVVGPKDLPVLLRRVGQFVARLRGMAAEFRASFDEMARQSELDELRREVEAMRSATNPTKMLTDAAKDASGADMFDDIHRGLAESGGQLHPPMGYQYQEEATGLASPADPEPVVEPAPKPARKPRKPRAEKPIVS